MVKTINNTFKQLFSRYQLLIFYYLILLLLGLLVARPVYITILNEAKKSVALDTLVQNFDFMIFTDFINQSWAAFRPFVSLISVLVLVFYLISNFFQGGLLYSIRLLKFRFVDFFEGGLRLCGRFLMLSVYSFIFLVVLVAFSGMFFFIFAAIAEGGSERTYILALIPPFLILGFFVSLTNVQNQYAKVMMNHSDSLGPWAAFGKAFSYVFKNPKTIIMYWLLVLLLGLIVLLYLSIDSAIGMRSGLTIFIMFLIQQAFIFARSTVKLSTWAVAQNYFLDNPVDLISPQKEINGNTIDSESGDHQ